MSLISFGEVLVDFLGHVNASDTYTKFPGGAPANVAVAYAKLGGTSAFIGKISNDAFGQYLNQSLQQYGVNTQHCQFTDDAKTALAFVSLDNNNDRSFSFFRDQTADLLFEKDDFKLSAFKESSTFHFCSNTLVNQSIFETTLYGLMLANSNQCITSFDLNLRLNLWSNLKPLADRVWRCVEQCKIVKMSKEELEYMSSLSFSGNQKETVNHCLELGVSLLIVTAGGNEVKWYTKSEQGVIQPPKVVVKDTTGAGDSFIAGVLYALNHKLDKTNSSSTHRFFKIIENNNRLQSILGFGASCGAISVTRQGAFPSFGYLNEVNSSLF